MTIKCDFFGNVNLPQLQQITQEFDTLDQRKQCFAG
jgi:hypothetical protein